MKKRKRHLLVLGVILYAMLVFLGTHIEAETGSLALAVLYGLITAPLIGYLLGMAWAQIEREEDNDDRTP